MGHSRPVKELFYSNKFKYLYSYSFDNTVMVWNPFVRRAIVSLKIDNEAKGVIKKVSFPNRQSTFCCLTDKNNMVFWDLNSFSKIGMKIYNETVKVDLIGSQPFIFEAGFSTKIFEYKELNIIEEVRVDNICVSNMHNLVVLALKNKIALVSLKNFNLLHQNEFEEINQIQCLKLSKNQKILYMTCDNKKLLIVNLFTSEILFELNERLESYFSINFIYNFE